MLTEKMKENMWQAGQRPFGRVKGQPNKLTASIKEAIEGAFNKLGGVDYLVKVGQKDPRTFCARRLQRY